jgi:transcriptional regulator with XRE-family HTH domain
MITFVKRLIMKDRLLQFLNAIQLSSSRFADEIGIQPSGVSHILSGRNNPSYDFIVKILSRFPELNADWLLLGEGNMFKESVKQAGLFENSNVFQKEMENVTDVKYKKIDSEDLSGLNKKDLPPPHLPHSTEKIIVLKSDGSFREYLPE